MPRLPAAAALLAATTLAATTLAAPLAAQDAATVDDDRFLRVGVRAGVSLPVGTLAAEDGGLAQTGFGFAGHVTIRPPRLPVALRGEVGYDRFGVDVDALGPEFEGLDANWGILAGTLNALVELPAAGTVRPYLIGGAGVYRAEQKVRSDDEGVAESNARTEPGVNGGGGLRLRIGRLDGYVEVRYHTLFTDGDRLSYVPLAIGVEF